MIIFLYGPDDYRREVKKRDLIVEFKKKHSGLGIGSFDFLDAGAVEAFDGFLKNQSMFEPSKLGILENVFEAESKELLKELKHHANDKAITLIISEREKPAKPFAFLLEKAGLSQAFEHLEGKAWEAFVAREAKRHSLRISPRALRILASRYEKDTWRLITEIQKLAFLAGTVEEKDLSGIDLELMPNFWDLIGGLKNSALRSRLTMLETVFGLGEPAGKIFNILAYQWREKLPRFAAYDLAVKTGKLDYEEALVDLVIS